MTSELLALSSGCNPVTIRGIMSALKKDGIISVKPGTGGVKLCCPLPEISLYRICKCVEPDALEKLMGIHQRPSPLCPVGRTIHAVLDGSYEEVRTSLKTSLQSISMQEIVKNYHHALAGRSDE